MSSLVRAIKAEMLKSKRSLAVWLSLAGTIANAVTFFLLSWFDLGAHTMPRSGSAWEAYILNHYEGIAFMMLPLFVIILATLLTFMEHRAGTWTSIMSLPITRTNIYLSKLIFGLLLFVAAHLLFVIGMLFTGLLTGLLNEQFKLSLFDFPMIMVLQLIFKTCISVLALFALHLWISVRFKYFIIPLTIGIIGFVLTTLLTPAFPFQWVNPYAYPISFMPDYNGAIQLEAWGWWSSHDVMSIVLGLFFTVVGVVEVRKFVFD